MTPTGWRNACLAFALLSAVLAWRGCTRRRPVAPPTAEACAALATDRDRDGDDADSPAPRGERRARRAEPTAGDDPATDDGEPAWSFTMPAWVLWLAPQPGEDLLHYRDRIVPLAQTAVAPHRARVARGRDDFARVAHLDDRQRAELDAAVAEAAEAITDRVFTSALGGELAPSRLKPMAAVTLARDVLDAVDRANRRFTASLRDDQRAALAGHPFDVGDYLLFSTRWEQALGVEQ